MTSYARRVERDPSARSVLSSGASVAPRSVARRAPGLFLAAVLAACSPEDFAFIDEASASSGGDGGPCTPGATTICYDGPPGTRSQGVCRDGTSICTEAGSWGPCDGEIVPSAEDCTTTDVDESCDGHPTCEGASVWTRAFGSAASEATGGVAASPAEVVVAGAASGSVDFGTGTVPGHGAHDAFVAVLRADTGETAAARIFGDGADQSARAVALAPDGGVVVVGTFEGSVDFGRGALTSAGADDAFIVGLDDRLGHRFSHGFGSAGVQSAKAVAVAPDGAFYVAGEFEGTLDLGSSSLTSAGEVDVFIAKFSAGGDPVWSLSFGAAGYQGVAQIAADASGVVITGNFDADFSIVGASVLPAAPPNDAIYLARFDAAGTPKWAKSFGDATDQDVFGVALDASGNVLLAGSFEQQIAFGGPPLSGSGPNKDAFVAKFTSGGAPVWSKAFGDPAEQLGLGVGADDADDVIVTGTFGGTVDFGGTPLSSADASDVFAVKLNAAGDFVWSRRFGGAGVSQRGTAISVTSDGSAYVAGAFDGTLGPEGPASEGAEDAFVMKLTP